MYSPSSLLTEATALQAPVLNEMPSPHALSVLWVPGMLLQSPAGPGVAAPGPQQPLNVTLSLSNRSHAAGTCKESLFNSPHYPFLSHQAPIALIIN